MPVIDPNDYHFFERLISDPVRLTQVLTNLLSNSLKFSHEGSRIEVTLRVRQAEPCEDGKIKI
jgi:signal transduction histidine kinase